jgi:hypothetical protein
MFIHTSRAAVVHELLQRSAYSLVVEYGDALVSRPAETAGRDTGRPILRGLHHQYDRLICGRNR